MRYLSLAVLLFVFRCFLCKNLFSNTRTHFHMHAHATHTAFRVGGQVCARVCVLCWRALLKKRTKNRFLYLITSCMFLHRYCLEKQCPILPRQPRLSPNRSAHLHKKANVVTEDGSQNGSDEYINNSNFLHAGGAYMTQNGQVDFWAFRIKKMH